MSFKLIVDEATLSLIAEKLPGQPIYAGPHGDLLTPGIVDIFDEEISDRWQPMNEHSKQLVLGMEACQDVLFYLDYFLDPKSRKRAMHRMAVPICTLIDVVRQLLSITNGSEFIHIRDKTWPQSDYDTYKKIAKRLKKMNPSSPVRRVRNKLAAHMDSDVFVEKVPSLQADDILEPLGDCVLLLMLSINYPSDFFHWIRPVGVLADKQHLAVETMQSYPISVRWITDSEGHVKDIESITLSADPRHELQEQILKTVDSYNNMIEAVNSKLPPIYIIPTADLRKSTAEMLDDTL